MLERKRQRSHLQPGSIASLTVKLLLTWIWWVLVCWQVVFMFSSSDKAFAGMAKQLAADGLLARSVHHRCDTDLAIQVRSGQAGGQAARDMKKGSISKRTRRRPVSSSWTIRTVPTWRSA